MLLICNLFYTYLRCQHVKHEVVFNFSICTTKSAVHQIALQGLCELLITDWIKQLGEGFCLRGLMPMHFMLCIPAGFFSWGGLGGPHPVKILPIPPIRYLSPFLDQGLSPQPRFIPKNLKKLNPFLCQIWLLLSSKVPWKAVFHA